LLVSELESVGKRHGYKASDGSLRRIGLDALGMAADVGAASTRSAATTDSDVLELFGSGRDGKADRPYPIRCPCSKHSKPDGERAGRALLYQDTIFDKTARRSTGRAF
jgi:hypothetical protein